MAAHNAAARTPHRSPHAAPAANCLCTSQWSARPHITAETDLAALARASGTRPNEDLRGTDVQVATTLFGRQRIEVEW